MTGAASPVAAALFAVLVLVSIALTIVAARRTRSTAAFYNAGGHIGGVANGVAISAEFTSAASLLGVIALFYTFGGDSLVYFISTVAGFAFVLFTMAARYRAVGRFTMADVLAYRFGERRALRLFAAISSLAVVSLYLISQLVGGGQLVSLLFGWDYRLSLVMICGLIVFFVTVGGMLAATWIQVLKASLFVGGLTILSIVLTAMFGFDFGTLLTEAGRVHPQGPDFMRPGAMLPDTWSGLSLAASLCFGVAGLPHILIRFCTVPDARTARVSMVVATLVVSLVVATYLFVALGAVALIADDPAYLDAAGSPRGGANLVFLHLIDKLGGPVLLGIVCAAVYATILAVVSGLVIAAVSALAYDIIGNGKADGASLGVTRASTLAVIAIGFVLALAFEKQNLGFTLSLAFAVAASANFPVLFLALHWPGLTARGALWGGGVGLASSILLVILGPTVWKDVLGNAAALFPYREPALFTIPLAFLVAWAASRAPAESAVPQPG